MSAVPIIDEQRAHLIERIRSNIPRQLLELPAWLLHDATKTPIYADGNNRRGNLDSPEDRARLVTFEQAAAALPRVTRAVGIGLALGDVPGEEIRLCGQDFDHCYRNGELDERVLQILGAANSYAERSPSGNGLHILGIGNIGTLKVDGAEIYSGGRYLTVTGDRINGAGLGDLAEAAGITRRLFGVPAVQAGAAAHAGNDEVLAALRGAGLYLRDAGGGKHLIRCPWEARHSPTAAGARQTSSSEAAYFQAGAIVRGTALDVGMFKCQHAHCQDRRLQHLREYLGLIPTQEPSDNVTKSGADTLRQGLQALTFSTLAEVNRADIAPKQAIVRDLIYPGAWLIVGRPKIGKSWFILQLALAVAERSTFLGFACLIAEVEVLCIFGEDDDARIKSRLQALGCANAPANVHVVNQQQLFALARRYAAAITFSEFLESFLQQHPAVRLVIVDTETTVRQIWTGEAGSGGTQRITETDYHQTRAFDEIGLRMKTAIGLVNHASKRKGEWTDIHELINRSNTALAGASGSIALADPPDADPFDPKSKTRLLGVRGRDLREDVLLAVHQQEEMPYFTNDGAYAEVRQSEAEQEVLQTLEELMPEVSAGGFVSAAELAEAMNKSRGAAKRTISRMLAKNRRTWKSWRILSKRGKDGGLRLEKFE